MVGIFPDDASVIRLVGAVLLEQHDEWAVAERRYLSEESMALIDQHLEEVTTTEQPELPAAQDRPTKPRVTDLLPPHHGARPEPLEAGPQRVRDHLRRPTFLRTYDPQQQ